jgi:ribosomal protein L23
MTAFNSSVESVSAIAAPKKKKNVSRTFDQTSESRIIQFACFDVFLVRPKKKRNGIIQFGRTQTVQKLYDFKRTV